MNPNALLLWMSARGEGSWQQFRAAVEELHLPSETPSQAEDDEESPGLSGHWRLRLNLQRLGHAEFAAGAGGPDWRVTPPTLALHQGSSGAFGVLIGARSDALMARIAGSAGSVSMQTYTADLCPDPILVNGPDQHALESFAESAGLRIQIQAPTAILLNVPPVDDRTVLRRADIPIGTDWRIERFSATRLGWASSSRDNLPGSTALFRFSARHGRQTILCLRGVPYSVPGQVGKYVILARRKRWVIRYNTSRQRLSVPASCRPPFLVERALVLCSGGPPMLEAPLGRNTILHYDDVPSSVAQLACAVLRQEPQE